MTSDQKEDVLRILLDAGEINSISLAMAMRFINKWQCSAFDAVLECHLINEQVMADVLARHFNVERVYASGGIEIGVDAFSTISYEEAVRWEVFPMGRLAGEHLFRLLIVNPTDYQMLDQVMEKVGGACLLSIAERSLVRRVIDERFPIELQIPSLVKYAETIGKERENREVS